MILFKELWVDTFIRLRPDSLREPPLADPHAVCCGGWGAKTPGYPISLGKARFKLLPRQPRLYPYIAIRSAFEKREPDFYQLACPHGLFRQSVLELAVHRDNPLSVT
jgi:hypothetical protein